MNIYNYLQLNFPAKNHSQCLLQMGGGVEVLDDGNAENRKIDLCLPNNICFGKIVNNFNNERLAFIRNELLQNNYALAQATFDYLVNGELKEQPHIFSINLNYTTTLACDNYYRKLNLENGVLSTYCNANGVDRSSQSFVGFYDGVYALQLLSSAGDSLQFDFSKHPSNGIVFEKHKIKNQTVVSIIATKAKVQNPPSFVLKIIADGDVVVDGNIVNIKNCTDIFLRAKLCPQQFAKPETAFDVFDNIESFESLRQKQDVYFAQNYNATQLNIEVLKTKHITLHSNFNTNFNLVSLYYNYSRYAIIAHSTTSNTKLPSLAYLSGKSNSALPVFELNDSLPIKFFALLSSNLPNALTPYVNLIEKIYNNGKLIANKLGLNGWCCFNFCDALGQTCPSFNQTHSSITAGLTAVISNLLYNFYLYEGDAGFLQGTVFEIIESAVCFYLNFLTEMPKTNKLIATPSSVVFENGKSYITKISNVDMIAINQLFKNYIHCAEILNINNFTLSKAVETLPKLYTFMPGKNGCTPTAFEKTFNKACNLKNLTHLFGAPSAVDGGFAFDDDKKIKSIIKQKALTFESLFIKIIYLVRQNKPDIAGKYLQKQFKLNKFKIVKTSSARGKNSGVVKNCSINLNYGLVAIVNEMLLQCQNGLLKLLPSLPKSWVNGSITGLKTLNNFIVDVYWENNLVSSFKIKHTSLLEANVSFNGVTASFATNTLHRINKN